MSLNCDNMWDLYMNGDYNNNEIDNCEHVNCTENITPTCSDIYISTKTMICYLNKEINLKNTFWKFVVQPEPHFRYTTKLVFLNMHFPKSL